MIILGFDTATPDTVVALTGAGEPVELRHAPAQGARPGHAAQLLPLATEALRRAGARWTDVDRIAVGVGPGTFTGLRIGVATARALAQAEGAELVGVSSLRALAAHAQDSWEGPVLAVLDARRGEAFVAAWAGDERIIAPAAVVPERLPEVVSACRRPPAPWLAVGDGALRFSSYLEPVGVSVPAEGSALHRISGLAVCRLAERAAPTAREDLVPDYVRAPDAQMRAGRQPAT
jgi:tRNA threonylcarbamoyladenosine biosynthesis protein TsaB